MVNGLGVAAQKLTVPGVTNYTDIGYKIISMIINTENYETDINDYSVKFLAFPLSFRTQQSNENE